MARHTYFRVGGPAEAFLTPETEADLVEAVGWAVAGRIPFLAVGAGTNLLVLDGGIPGLVISLKGYQDAIGPVAGGGGLRVSAGTGLRALCGYCLSRGFSGMNFAVGIPGTLGGGVAMNAGTRLGSMEEVVGSVRVLLPGSSGPRVAEIGADRLRFAYRSLDWSGLPEAAGTAGPPLLLSADLRLGRGEPGALRREALSIWGKRRQAQPIGQPSAGCFFKNPPAGPGAGRFIDQAGLKGRRVGDAEVSRRHANFIVNRGRARAADVLELAARVEETVQAAFGVRLEREVKVVGV